MTRHLCQVAAVLGLTMVSACASAASTSVPARAKAPSESPSEAGTTRRDHPATAGACEGPMPGAVGTVEVDPDTPAPRCLIVLPGQRLRVVNTTARLGQPGSTVVVSFAQWPRRSLEPGESVTFDEPVAQAVDFGVHRLDLDVGGLRWGSEIWLKRSSAAVAPAAIRLVVPSHCGVLSVRVGGTLWLADPPLGDHNPPPGWDENETPGYLRKDGPDTATFFSDSGRTAFFRRAPDGTADPAAGCE